MSTSVSQIFAKFVAQSQGRHRSTCADIDTATRTGRSGVRALVISAVRAGPALLAVGDNGPQMRSDGTGEFMAPLAIAQQFGRPSTPTDRAWIETLFGPGVPGRVQGRVRQGRGSSPGAATHPSRGIQRREVARGDRICGSRRRTRGSRRDPPRAPRGTGTGPPKPHRLPSSTTIGHAMRTRSLVAGYFHPVFSHELRYTPLPCIREG